MSHIDEQSDGQYVLAYNHHFVAFRLLDGLAEVNFTHKSHMWEQCMLADNVTSKPIQFCSKTFQYIVNVPMMDGIFKISQTDEMSFHTCHVSMLHPLPSAQQSGQSGIDLVGGSFPGSQARAICLGVRSASFLFHVCPLTPLLSSHPHLRLTLPNLVEELFDFGKWFERLWHITTLLGAHSCHSNRPLGITGASACKIKPKST